MATDPEKAMEVVDNKDNPQQEEVRTKNGVSEHVMNALQHKLSSMIGAPSPYIQSLPAPVKRRLKSLKKIQLEATKIESQFYEEVHRLECKYQQLYVPLYDKRSTIVKGEYEPNDEECEWESDEELEDEEVSTKKEENENIEPIKALENEVVKDAKGVPEFWLTIFKNVDILQEMVQEHDEPVLTHLEDLTVTFQESNPMGFTLHFNFSPNEYFTNSVLTKEYFMKCEPSESDPFSFEGPEIYKCVGCEIDWKKGKKLTVKTVVKKQKHATKGNVRSLTKTVKADSFFNFFDPPAIPDDPDADVDPEMQELVSADFEIGHYIRERVIPKAVLFFTGEALEDDDDYEDDSDEDEDDDSEDDDEDEDEDPDFDPSKAPKGQNAAE